MRGYQWRGQRKHGGLSPPPQKKKKELSPPNKCVSSQIDVDEVLNIFAKMPSLRLR